MKLFGYDIKRIEKVPLPTNTAKKPPNVTVQQFPQPIQVNGEIVTWQANGMKDQVQNGYCGNDIVYSIIRMITDKAKVAPWAEYKIKDEEQYKRYIAITSEKGTRFTQKEILDIRTKALELVKVSGRVTELLRYPNPIDSWKDIVDGHCVFKLTTGNGYLYGNQVAAGVNKGIPLELWNLPAQYMSIIMDSTVFPNIPSGYQLLMQYTQMFTNDQILHDKYTNPNWDVNGSQLYGQSPLKAAAKVLTRSNEGKQAAVSNYQNGGPKGILFVADDRYDPNMSVQEAVDIKKTLARNQGSLNVNQVETSGYKVDYVPLGLTPVELDLLNAESYDIQALCNVYGVPSALLGVKGGMTYNGMPEAEKALTSRCAIPLLADLREQMNRKLMKDWGNTKTVVDFDISVYGELQEDKEKQVRWLKDAPIKTGRKLEILGESTEGYSTEQLDSIIIGSGSTTLDEVIAPAPINIPNGLNDYDQSAE